MISETCSVCGTSFDVMFRYQMEERNGGFAFYCSQKCLEKSQKGGDAGSVNCDACSKRFAPELVSQILYVGGKRRHACSLECRSQLQREAQGTRLGDLAREARASADDAEARPAADVRPAPADARPPARIPAPTPIAPMPAVARTPATMPAPAHHPAAPAVTAAWPPPVVVTTPPAARPPASVSAAVPPAVRPTAATPPAVKPGALAAPAATPVSAMDPGSSIPAPQSVPVPSAGPASAAPATQGSRTAAKATTRARREEAPVASTRQSGLMAAIRDDAEAAAPARDERAARPRAAGDVGNTRSDIPGTVVPLVPPLKGEKKAPEPRAVPPRRIAVFNHKGGTGKTTTAVSIAAGLAAKGKKVLLVDTDAQGNVSVSLGAGSERSLYHVLVMGLRVGDSVKEVRPNLHLLPSNETLAAAELYLAGRQNRDRVLADRLSPAAGDYDYVVLDCSPSLSLMNQNALVFADSVLVPVACDYLSLVGVRQVLKTVKNVNSLLHHPVQIWGVLPTFYDSRAKICNEAIATLKDHFGDKCLPPIRAAIKVKEAPSVGQTIFEYAAGSNAAEDYGVIVDRIMGVAAAAPSGETARDPQQVGQTARATA